MDPAAPRVLWSQCTALERALKTALRGPAGAGSAQPAELRMRLQGLYVQLLLADPVFARAHDVDQLLWKHVHYKPIEEARRRIKQMASRVPPDANLAATISAFLGFLTTSMGFYQDLLAQLCRQHRIDPALVGFGVVAGSLASLEADATSGAVLQSCHRSLVYLGDLSRYAQQHSGMATKDWDMAVRFYTQAARLCPDHGQPHNQLAVVATHRHDDFEAVYRYVRALSVAHPFGTARANLDTLFTNARGRVLPGASAGAVEQMCGLAVRLHGLLFQDINHGDFGPLLEQFVDVLTRVVALPSDAAVVTKIVVLNMYAVRACEGDAARAAFAQSLAFRTVGVVAAACAASPGSEHLQALSVGCDWLRYNMHLLQPRPWSVDARGMLGQVAELGNSLSSAADGAAAAAVLGRVVLAEDLDLRGFAPLGVRQAAHGIALADEPTSRLLRQVKIRTFVEQCVAARVLQRDPMTQTLAVARDDGGMRSDDIVPEAEAEHLVGDEIIFFPHPQTQTQTQTQTLQTPDLGTPPTWVRGLIDDDGENPAAIGPVDAELARLQAQPSVPLFGGAGAGMWGSAVAPAMVNPILSTMPGVDVPPTDLSMSMPSSTGSASNLLSMLGSGQWGQSSETEGGW